MGLWPTRNCPHDSRAPLAAPGAPGLHDALGGQSISEIGSAVTIVALSLTAVRDSRAAATLARGALVSPPGGQLPPTPRTVRSTRTIVATAKTPWPMTTDSGKCRSGGTAISPGLPSGPGVPDLPPVRASLGAQGSRRAPVALAGAVKTAAGGLVGLARYTPIHRTAMVRPKVATKA